MKAILEFNLDDADDALTHKQMLAAKNLLAAIWEFKTELRSIGKYNSESLDPHTLEIIQTLINAALIDNDVNFDELYF